MCDNNEAIDGSQKPFGVITSPNYPQWIPNKNCRVTINAPTDKVIRVYISDISTEPEELNESCEKSRLTFYSGSIETTYCGDKKENGGDYDFVSCTNRLDILWRSSSLVSSPLRGFNVYYELIDKLNIIQCPNATRPTRITPTTYAISISTILYFGFE